MGLPRPPSRVIGISPATLRRRKSDDRVVHALEKGKAAAAAKVGKALFERATGGDITSIIWWEKTRAGRTDRASFGGPSTTVILQAPPKLTSEEWKAQYTLPRASLT